MGSEWQTFSLADLYDFSSGLSKPRSAFGSGYPFLSFKDVFYNSAVPSQLHELVNSTERERARGSVERGDVFLTRTSETMEELAMSSVALTDIPDATFNGFTKRLRPKHQRRVAPEFARYYFRSRTFRQDVYAMSSLSTRASLNNEMLERLVITLPSYEEQLDIGETLGALDDRIDLLRQTNTTLEAIAQALFKSWFVDFDPVHAKAEGREPEAMDPATAALFPSELEESELGLIPKGWRVCSIYDIANVKYGAPFASSKFNTEGNGLPLVRIRDLRAEQPGVWTPEVHPKGYLIQPGDIIVGMDGEFRAHLWGGEPAWMNQRVCVFHSIAPHCNVFVRNAIAAPLAQVEATETATTVIHLGKGDIDQFKVVAPSDEVAAAFAACSQPLYDKIVSAKQQARNLADLRDTLLPRLISGKLRLPEATEVAEEDVA